MDYVQADTATVGRGRTDIPSDPTLGCHLYDLGDGHAGEGWDESCLAPGARSSQFAEQVHFVPTPKSEDRFPRFASTSYSPAEYGDRMFHLGAQGRGWAQRFLEREDFRELDGHCASATETMACMVVPTA